MPAPDPRSNVRPAETRPPAVAAGRAGGPRAERLVGVALVVLTLLVYARSFHYPFVNYDDPGYVSRNPHVAAGLTADGVRWAFTTLDCGYWQPVTWLSLELD